MFDTNLFSENVEILDSLQPISQGAATVNGAYKLVDKYTRVVFILSVGVMSASATLDFKLQQAKDTGGTSVKDITGKAITQLTQAGGGSGKNVIVELRTDKLDVANGFKAIRFVLTEAAAASVLGVLVLGVDVKYDPVLQTNWAQVV